MQTKRQFTIALAGNPNVGKSTVFNNLTGLNQHTGNWTGKTVENAKGICKYNGDEFEIMDLPGTYSLMSDSGEEELARNYLCFGMPDAVAVVVDATLLERNLNLLLQILEITDKVVLCLNLMDEAKKKQIIIDSKKLSTILGIPVVTSTATKKEGVFQLLDAAKKLIINDKLQRDTYNSLNQNNFAPLYISEQVSILNKSISPPNNSTSALMNPVVTKDSCIYSINYGNAIETAIDLVSQEVGRLVNNKINSRFVALKLLGAENSIVNEVNSRLKIDLFSDYKLKCSINLAKDFLKECGIESESAFIEEVTQQIFIACESITSQTVRFENPDYNKKNLKIDRILTSRLFGIPIMLAFLAAIFFITIQLANYPSTWLASLFGVIEGWLNRFFVFIRLPDFVRAPIMDGVFRTTTWVVAVMLPPMAIFFPLFTLLEDFGYLPRVAFNLDKPFKKCGCCGKQSLTMCMGFGCNAAAVVGTRIIDSPRERLIAILTNSLVPCNGRFPTLITLSSVTVSGFFMGGVLVDSIFGGFISTLTVTAAVILGIFATFLVSRFLSKTFLKGIPSNFTLELPPYRKPQIRKVLIRSLLDRTIKVLLRAVIVAAPCGLVIWLLANLSVGGNSLLYYVASFLHPLAKIMGLDGYILTAFILGFPANEIVLPIAIMSYTAAGTLSEVGDILTLTQLLKDNGWTLLTIVNTMIFCLFHFPCATTCLSIKKETKSIKWTTISIILPTLLGVLLCMTTTLIAKLFLLF